MARFLTLELKTDFFGQSAKNKSTFFFGKSMSWLVKMTHRKDSKQVFFRQKSLNPVSKQHHRNENVHFVVRMSSL